MNRNDRRSQMIKKLAVVSFVSAVSFLSAPYAYCGDLADTARAAASLTGVKGNVAVGVNSGSGKADIKAESEGQGSVANAGLGVVDAKSGGTGKEVNLAVGVNTAKATISATAKGGGKANAGLGVVHSGE
jgi:hypothetical protein